MRGAEHEPPPPPPTEPPTPFLISSQSWKILTENVSPMISVNQNSGHRFCVAPCWSFGPLLTSGKGLTKSKPGTLTFANHRMTQGGGDLPPHQKHLHFSAEHPLFLGTLAGKSQGIILALLPV